MGRTKAGLGLMQVFFLLNVLSDAVIASGTRSVMMQEEIDQTIIQQFGSTLCLGRFVGFIAFLVLIFAVYKIYKDKHNYPLEHEESVNFAIIFYVLAVIGGMIYVPLNTLFFAIASVLLVKELAPSFEKKLLYSSAGVNLLTAIGFVMMYSVALNREVSLEIISYQVYWVISASIIGSVLFMLTYRRISSNLDERTDRSSENFFTDLNFGGEGKKRCPECGKYTFEEKGGRFLLCSECNHVETMRDGDDLE